MMATAAASSVSLTLRSRISSGVVVPAVRAVARQPLALGSRPRRVHCPSYNNSKRDEDHATPGFVDWYESPVSSVMTDLVHDVDADAPISSARELLNKYNFTGIPVTEHHLGVDGSYHAASPNQSVQGGDGRLVVGIISKKDLPADADDTFYQTHLCRSIMTSPAIIVPSDGSIEDAAKIMLEHRICRVPVIDPTNNHLVGVVSRSDVFIEPLADTD
uniref:CBS domain-containing protein n=1 Tax=Pycnococcus provasolii TaxID=41880 RepID=A0A7S2BFD8_9CHLO|mmetsp:Transcript_8404/g.19054  ORF Transcript_8404/g.19054 Transcript_8404/m.19054 type:complete len:217 (+) Transcript_8404:65-715(+)